MHDITYILNDLTPIDGQPMTTSRKVATRFGKQQIEMMREAVQLCLLLGLKELPDIE